MVRGKNGRSASRREPSSRKSRKRTFKKRPQRHLSKAEKKRAILEQKGHENIQFILDFSAYASSGVLGDMEYLERLQRLLLACRDDDVFIVEFPPHSIENFRTKNGKPLSGDGMSKAEHFRSETIPYCAKKLYDMLSHSEFHWQLNATYASYGGEIEAYYRLYNVAIAVAHPEQQSAVS